MGLGYKRADLKKIAQAKLDDAMFLFKYKRFSNAYYLAGYAVEIALKACIASQIAADTIPDKAFINSVWTHSPKNLASIAGLSEELRNQEDKDPDFAANWAIVAEWVPDARYESCDSITAQSLLEAIAHPKSGVLAWIRTHW